MGNVRMYGLWRRRGGGRDMFLKNAMQRVVFGGAVMCTTDSEWVSDPKLYKTWRVEEFGTLQSGGEVFDVSDHPCHLPVPAVVTKMLSLGSECPRKGTHTSSNTSEKQTSL